MMERKQIRAILLYEFKMGRKAAETANIREVLPGNRQNAPKTATFMPSIDQSKRTNSSTWQRMSHKWLRRNWTNWYTKLYLTQLTHQTSLRPTTTFSSTSTTSCKRRFSTTKQQLKTPSKSSSVLELQNSMRINRLVSCWQKCIDFNGSYFD